MNELDRLLIKNLQRKLKDNSPCAFITIESNELKRLLKIVKKESEE